MKDFDLTLTDAALFPGRVCTITRRDGTVIRIADSEASLTVGSLSFAAVAGVEISAVKHTLGGDVPSFEIVAAHSDGGTFDTADINNGLYDGAEVLLHIVNRDALDALGLLFSGTIQSVSFSILGSVTFDVRGPSVEAEAFIPSYAPMCRTDLFSSLCGLAAASFEHAGTVGAIIDRFNVTVADLASPPADGWFNQGVGVNADTGFRFEIANWTLSTLRLTTYLPVCQLFTVGDALTLYPGCDKIIATCHSKFSNTTNFQGEPHFLGAAAASAG